MIEVGVDVPEATVMVIEQAERFGLAQLHQLRGRVGRGARPSSCLLLYGAPLGAVARARLEVMRATDDGFRIAEEDLRLRGPGEVLGARQSGLPALRLADLAHHADLLAPVRDDVRLCLARDPELRSPRGRALRQLLRLFEREAAVRLSRLRLARGDRACRGCSLGARGRARSSAPPSASSGGPTMPPEITSLMPVLDRHVERDRSGRLNGR